MMWRVQRLMQWWGWLSHLRGTWSERSAASRQLFVSGSHFPHAPNPPAGWGGSGRAQWRTQSLAAARDSCAPETRINHQTLIIPYALERTVARIWRHFSHWHTLPPSPRRAGGGPGTLSNAALGNRSAAACKEGRSLGPDWWNNSRQDRNNRLTQC